MLTEWRGVAERGLFFTEPYIFMGFRKLYNTNRECSYRSCVNAVRTYRNLWAVCGCVCVCVIETDTKGLRGWLPLLIRGRANWKAWTFYLASTLQTPFSPTRPKRPIYYIIGFSPRSKARYSPVPTAVIPFIRPLSVFLSNKNKKEKRIYTPFNLHPLNSNVNANTLQWSTDTKCEIHLHMR
jgi:hypothetical protein